VVHRSKVQICDFQQVTADVQTCLFKNSGELISGFGRKFDADRERQSNQNMRTIINTVKERVRSLVDTTNASAVTKAAHYLSALDAQLEVCDRTDEYIDQLQQPIGGRSVRDL